MKTLMIAAAAFALAAPALAQEENEVSMDEVPEAAMQAALDNAPGGQTEFDSVAIDPDDDTETYEFAGTMENGMGFEVDVLADGTVEEIEEEITMEEVPEEVTAALEENATGFEPSYIERSTREDGEMIVYEMEGMMDGQEVDIEINEDGSNYTMNEDSAA